MILWLDAGTCMVLTQPNFIWRIYWTDLMCLHYPEHWLFGGQLHKISNCSCDFTGHGIASQSNPDILSGGRGHGGEGILWSTAFSDFVH